jgi:ATP-dependent Clp protease adaptor protein ClpS
MGTWEYTSPLFDTMTVTDIEAELETQVRTQRPPMFKVMLLNDDYTPMEFVVQVLMQIFRHSQAEAVRIMLEVHSLGAGTCGIYTRDVAETKAEQTLTIARSEEHPLQCVVQEA